MTLSLGMKAQIRSMVFVAGEPIPYFYPMKAFIHHNPLHGLEKKPFSEAIAEGHKLFKGDGFLLRSVYQQYLHCNAISADSLKDGIDHFLQQSTPINGVDFRDALFRYLTKQDSPVNVFSGITSTGDIRLALAAGDQAKLELSSKNDFDEQLSEVVENQLDQGTFYESLDVLFDTGIGDELDELVIKSCLDFFDEGQSVWGMPEREKGFFTAWREVARRNARLFLRGRKMLETLEVDDDPEGIIVHVMERLNIPRDEWVKYFRRELARLYGWTGFIRWRSQSRKYYMGQKYPGDLVDFLAIRLTLALAIIYERREARIPACNEQLHQFVREHPQEAYLRLELYGKRILPAWAQRVEMALLSGNNRQIEAICVQYRKEKRRSEARHQANVLTGLLAENQEVVALESLTDTEFEQVLSTLKAFESREGMIWLEAMEATAMNQLVSGIDTTPPAVEDKRPFVQALFCIDTRSERYRRHLESVGDYQTFGIAGFFGVPVGFMELGKGSEVPLCPVLLTPKNLVMEMSVNDIKNALVLSSMEKAVHDLKESVLAPFVTVEAIGILFGLDMAGKTLAPTFYNRLRSQLDKHNHKPNTHLLIDKLSREQADSIVRAVQRAVIAKAIENEFDLAQESIHDDMVKELREAALDNAEVAPVSEELLNLDKETMQGFIQRLRNRYKIKKSDARAQMNRLGRIGFTLDEQVGFVSQALRAIGLINNFSRFVLVVGHGSQSENNPYESALDCGACGGNIGIFNARVFSHMANKPIIRQRLLAQGITIPDDTFFVPALHNTTTDEVRLYDLELLPASHPIYIDRLQNGLIAARRLCAQERIPELDATIEAPSAKLAVKQALLNAMDWSQVRPEWGLSRNAYFVIGRRALTENCVLDGRAFLHSYDYRLDSKLRLLENILTGPLVVAQWINMEHYFSTVDNEHYGSGSKVYHNVACRFGVMTGNLSDLRTGLPAQTVLKDGKPYHEPMRLITVIEAPLTHVHAALDKVAVVRNLLKNGWLRILVVDPEAGKNYVYSRQEWLEYPSQTSDENLMRQKANLS